MDDGLNLSMAQEELMGHVVVLGGTNGGGLDDGLNLSMAQEELMGHVVVGGTNGGGPHGRRSQSFYGSGRVDGPCCCFRRY